MAALLAFSVFLICLFVGFAVLMVLDSGRNQIRNLLLAPIVGATLLLLITLQLNVLGLGVGRFAAPLVIIALIASFAVIAARRPAVPWRALGIFGTIAVVAFVLTDRPLFEFGFNWVSFGNDDMVNYANSAERFVRAGYAQPPPMVNIHDLLRSVDAIYWGWDNIGAERAGFDLLLALVISLTGLKGIQAFMPLMAAGHLMLVWAAGALVCRGSRLFFPGVVAAAVAFSALTSLGVLYQLGAQVFGLAILAFGVIVLTDRQFLNGPLKQSAGSIVIAMFGVIALIMVYPELSFFLIATVVGFIALETFRRTIDLRRAVLGLGLAGLATVVVLNHYFMTMMLLLTTRVSAGASSSGTADLLTFPYYLVPSGIANFWGLLPIAQFPHDPWMSILIAIGMLLSLIAIPSIVFSAWRSFPGGLTAASMLALGVMLAMKRADFGMYKLAMYIQPFMFASIAEALYLFGVTGSFGLSRNRGVLVAATMTGAMAAIGLLTQHFYVDVSRDVPGSPAFGFIEIPHASANRLLDQLSEISKEPTSGTVVSDAANISLIKAEADFERGHTYLPITGEALYRLVTPGALPPPLFARNFDEVTRIGTKLRDMYYGLVPFETFYFDPASGAEATVMHLVHPPDREVFLLSSTGRQTIINRSTIGDTDHDVVQRPSRTMPNHLEFALSSRTYYAGSANRSQITFYQLESDYFYPKSSMSALGRYLLFEVSRPSKKIRLILSITSSLAHDGENKLPPALAVGNRVVAFSSMGRGSARLISPPLAPQQVSGRAYVGVDLRRDGKMFQYPRPGLMGLYGRKVAIDPREIVVFGRDISAISDDEYRRWSPPGLLSTPSDFENPQLEYSGFYEDGWVSDAAYAILKSGVGSTHLVLDGFVPFIDNRQFSTMATVLVDGRAVTSKILKLGDFLIEQTLRLSPGRHQVALRFSRTQTLPLPDGRKASVKLRKFGFPEPTAAVRPR